MSKELLGTSELAWSYPMSHADIINALAWDSKKTFLSPTGINLTEEEFIERYLNLDTPHQKFRAAVDDYWVLIIQPEFDIAPIIEWVKDDMQRIMGAVQWTTEFRKEIKKAARAPKMKAWNDE